MFIFSILQPNVLSKLLKIVSSPSFSKEEKYKFKYPFLISEMLTEEITEVKNALMGLLIFLKCIILTVENSHLDVLFSTVSNKQSGEPPYAYHICRVFHCLLNHAAREV
jgi:hypothetical protein